MYPSIYSPSHNPNENATHPHSTVVTFGQKSIWNANANGVCVNCLPCDLTDMAWALHIYRGKRVPSQT